MQQEMALQLPLSPPTRVSTNNIEHIHRPYIIRNHALMVHYENKTNKSVQRCMNLLPANIISLLHVSATGGFFKGYITKNTKTILQIKHKYRV
jgi:hypothetical protein